MSKHARLLAGAVLIAGVMAAPVGARAKHHHGGGHHGGHHGGGHYGGSYHGGHHGGHHGYHGGGRGGVYFGFGAPGFYYGAPYVEPYYDDPYYYEPPPPPPDCNWVQIRVWRHGRWVWRSVQRCD